MSREARLQFIEESIKRNKKVSLKEVCLRYEVNEKTVRRDIEYLRDSCGAPIKYSRKVEGYCYDYEFSLYTNEKEKRLLFYSLISNMAHNLNYVPVQCDGFLKQLEESIEKSYLDIARNISYELSDTEPVDLDIFSAILQSIRVKQQLLINYTGRNGKKSSRNIEVLKIINYGGKWYLLSYCHQSQAMRNFMVSRISNCELTNQFSTELLSDEMLDQNLTESFGIFKEVNPVLATIKFSPEIYHLIKNQIWHSAQTVSEDNGAFLLSLPVGEKHEEIIGRVLKFGEQAEILSPSNLREEWQQTIRRMWLKISTINYLD